jgi:hypothetical protein
VSARDIARRAGFSRRPRASSRVLRLGGARDSWSAPPYAATRTSKVGADYRAVGDATEAALRARGESGVRPGTSTGRQPFDSVRKRMSVVAELEGAPVVPLRQGALRDPRTGDRILYRGARFLDDSHRASSKAKWMPRREEAFGYWVSPTARSGVRPPSESGRRAARFPRPHRMSTPCVLPSRTIQSCHRAGIRVLMLPATIRHRRGDSASNRNRRRRFRGS